MLFSFLVIQMSLQVKLYENVVIGNFLYGLGFAVRSCLGDSPGIPTMVNLLQQSPADTSLADVLLTFPGIVRLIEFKMETSKKGIKKEEERVQRLFKALENEGNPSLIEVSRKVHWYVEVGIGAEKEVVISRVASYLDAFLEDSGLAPKALEDLIKLTAQEAVEDTSDERDCARDYLQFVRKALKGKNAIGGGGLVLIMDNDGGVNFVRIQSLTDLNLSLSSFQQRALQRDLTPSYGF